MILLYHSVIPDGSPMERICIGQALPQSAFESQIRWLADRHRIVSLAEYIEGWSSPSFRETEAVALTFDDGFRTTFQCISPFLVKSNIPATIFVTTSHLDHGELLWFSYLKALCFEQQYKVAEVDGSILPLQTLRQRSKAWGELRKIASECGDPVSFCRSLAYRYPIDSGVVDHYRGMSNEQLVAVGKSSLIDLGAHTVHHAFLSQMSKEAQQREIFESKRDLSIRVGKPVRYFAYPSGDYNRDTLELVQEAGYEASFAVLPRRIGAMPQHEIERIGVYSQSIAKLWMKTVGVVSWMRRCGIRVG